MKQIEMVKGLLSEVTLGAAESVWDLTLVPVFGSKPGSDYLVASEAFGLGMLVIDEIGGGQVPEVVVANRSDLPVLLIDGEHLVGAKQDRIINISVMLPAHSKTMLPVSCVEQGRWGYEGESGFAPSREHAYARLRQIQAEATVAAARKGARRAANQGQIWTDVATKHRESGVKHSMSGAMADAYRVRRGFLDEVRARFERPQEGQSGVVACVGDRPIATDLFDRSETLTKVWPRLITGYAMDAVGAEGTKATTETARRFITEASDSEATMHDGLGLGFDVAMTSRGVVGNALAWDDAVIHAALFSRGEQGAEGPQPGRASARRRKGYLHG